MIAVVKRIRAGRKKRVFTSEERAAWQLPKPLTVSEWADSNRYLDPMTSAEPGQWITDRTPYLRGIMDAFNDPMTEDITIIASTQVGKTECLMNMIGYAIEEDPGPALFVIARIEDCATIATDRVRPMIELSPSLAGQRTRDSDDITKKGIRTSRMILYFAGSNSPAGLSGKPIRYLFMDEVDKYPKFSGKEADPVKLSTERTRTFWNRKIVKASTPTTRDGLIFREFCKTDRRRFYVPCPHCGEHQLLLFPNIKWPEGETDAEKILTQKLAWYECPACKGHIHDADKNTMMLSGHWVPEGCMIDKAGAITGDVPQTSRRGYWINCLYSPWLTFSEIAAEFLKSKENVAELMNFVNSWLAEIWEEKVEETTESTLKKRILDYPEGSVPAGALVLTAGVDVQKDHFYYVIRGWGYGEESWLIRASSAETFAEVEEILIMTNYVRADNQLMKVRIGCVDSGYRADEVYNFCRQHRHILRAIKGVDTLPGGPFSMTRIDKNPRTGAVIPGGVMLYKLDTSYYKDKLARLISKDQQEDAQFHVYNSPPEDYFKQMTAEHKVLIRDKKSGKAWHEWQLKAPSLPNHFLDAEVYDAAAAEMIYVASMRRETQQKTFTPRTRESSGFIQRSGGQEGWLKKSGNWVNR